MKFYFGWHSKTPFILKSSFINHPNKVIQSIISLLLFPFLTVVKVILLQMRKYSIIVERNSQALSPSSLTIRPLRISSNEFERRKAGKWSDKNLIVEHIELFIANNKIFISFFLLLCFDIKPIVKLSLICRFFNFM